MEITIRAARRADLNRVVYIEQQCFPKAEAATYERLSERIHVFVHSFFVAEKKGEVIGFINGCVTKQRKLTDDLYESTMFYDDKADYQMVFGLDVLPSEQHQGIAKMLMKAYIAAAHERNKKAVILTCKKHLIPFYKQFGYTCEGRSGSLHGGAVWYDMILLLHEKT